MDYQYVRYSKADHTPKLINSIDVVEVQAKCPLFRHFFKELIRLDCSKGTMENEKI